MGDLDQYEVKDDLSKYEVKAEGPPGIKPPPNPILAHPDAEEVGGRLGSQYGPTFGFMAGGGINTLGETGALETAAETVKGIATSPKAKAVGKVAGQYGLSKIPYIGGLVRRPSYGDVLDALKTKAPEVAAEAAPAVAATTSPGFNVPSVREPVPLKGGPLRAKDFAIQRPPEGAGAPIPTKAPTAPPETAPKPNTSPKQVESLLSQGMGGKSLLPDVPLRKQVPATPPPTAEAPSAHIPVESSAMKSFKYDPAAKELEVKSASGAISIHGDVSPEQAQAFQEAPSKGKAWNELKKNSTYVGKIVNGKRINIKPPKAMGSASPDDLTDILTESVKQARQR